MAGRSRNLGRFGTLLAMLVLVFGVAPFLQGRLLFGIPIFRVFFNGLFIAGVVAVSGDRRLLTIGIGFAVFAFASSLAQPYSEASWVAFSHYASDAAFLGFIVLAILYRVFQEDRVTGDTVLGGICVYLLLGLAWHVVYSGFEFFAPGSFVVGDVAVRSLHAANTDPANFPELLYFSFVTLTTLGYGEITPHSEPARMLCTAEAITGQLFVAVFIARLVALQVAHAADTRRADADPPG